MRWLLWGAVVFAAFVFHRASQYRAAGAASFEDGLRGALQAFPAAPEGKAGVAGEDVSGFALQMLIVLPVLHLARVT